MPKFAGLNSPRGFTLIELIVVIAIVAIGWFGFLPNLDFARHEEEKNGPLDTVNAVMAEIRLAALTNDQPQLVRVDRDQNGLVWRKELYPFPLPLAGITVNEEDPRTAVVPFLVYRSGAMDKVRIQLAGNVNLVSLPLEGLFIYEEPDSGVF